MKIIPKITYNDQFDGKLAAYGSDIVSDRVKSPGNNRQNSPGKNGEFTIKAVL